MTVQKGSGACECGACATVLGDRAAELGELAKEYYWFPVPVPSALIASKGLGGTSLALTAS